MNSQISANISEPFDPSNIDVERKSMPISMLITMLDAGIIDLEPKFQRNSDLWSHEKQSRLIESILLKLPIPSMYFDFISKDRKYSVIDGLQRLCAIRNFAVDKSLRLCGMEYLTDYEGKTYDDLDFQDKLAIGLEEIVVNVLKGTTPANAKYMIFQRLNSGSLSLTKAEIRNAVYQGSGLEMIKRLALDECFVKQGFSNKRKDNQEAILRLVAFVMMGVESYSGRMETFLNITIERLNRVSTGELDALETKIKLGLRRLYDLFGEKAHKCIFSQTKKPSKPLFDALATGLTFISEEKFACLLENNGEFTSLLQSLSMDSVFMDSIKHRSDRKELTIYRHNKIKVIIEEIVKE